MRALLILLVLAAPVTAETIPFRPFPVEWRGFLSDLRVLRNAANPAPGPNPLRESLQARVTALEAQSKRAALSADDTADLAECHVRLGQPLKAVALLRTAHAANPKHYRCAVGLGIAWASAGDWAQAAVSLEEAIPLSSAESKAIDELHHKLALARSKETAKTDGLDDLFGVAFLGESGKPQAGKLPAEQQKKLPRDAIALVEQLLVRSPADARLLWQLGELANASGDVRTAANILEGCVGDFALKNEDARNRRRIYKAAADEIAKSEDHTTHRGTQAFKSPRLFAKLTDEARLPRIDPKGLNRLPWSLLGDTTLGPKLQPKFLKYVEELDGKTVELVGFMRPFSGNNADEFLLVEYPVGCWFCDQPGPLQIAVVEMEPEQRAEFSAGVVIVKGKLVLNHTEPERYLFVIRNASVKKPD